MINKEVLDLFRVPPNQKVRLKDYHTGWAQTEKLEASGKDAVKERSQAILDENLKSLAEAQDLLYADNRFSLLIIFQALDAAGKDGTIKHVMSGVNPQGCQVFSFKQPSAEELDHNFLWRYTRCLPERGRIGIFNRSYYEDVLVVKVHPELLKASQLPRNKFGKKFWKQRYEDINALEKHLVRNGTVVLKFFLHVSKEEQRKRFLDRLDRPEKNWKFSAADVTERGFWSDYIRVYEDALSATSTKAAPWHVVPADDKWATRAVVADLIVSAIKDLDLKHPVMSDPQKKMLSEARQKLLAE